MNGFFAKHGTTSVEDERPLENRAKKHKLKLLDMAKKNVVLHNHEIDGIRLLDAETRWLKLVKRFPHKANVSTMTRNHIASIAQRKPSDVKGMKSNSSSTHNTSQFVAPAPRKSTGFMGDDTDDDDISRMESLDQIYQYAEAARRNLGDSSQMKSFESDVVNQLIGEDKNTFSGIAGTRLTESDIFDMETPSPSMTPPPKRKRPRPGLDGGGRISLSRGDDGAGLLDETTRQLSSMSVGDAVIQADTAGDVDIDRMDSLMSLGSTGLSGIPSEIIGIDLPADSADLKSLSNMTNSTGELKSMDFTILGGLGGD